MFQFWHWMKKVVAKVFTLLFLLTFSAEVVTYVSAENLSLNQSDDTLSEWADSPSIFSALFEESETAEEENNESKERTELVFSELFDLSIKHFLEETRSQEKFYRLGMLCRVSHPQFFKRTHSLLI